MVENPDQSGYSWIKSDNGSGKMTRKFANLERMFVIFNRNLHGQNCPLVGANISLQGREYSSKIKPFNISQLHARAVKAFCQTRWRYPTVAARVLDGDTASYNIESGDGIEQWADRTVFTICQDGGWIALRERLSREASLPSPDGDCCLFYVIVRPDETIKPEIQTFDILMHTHHAFTDGSGIRVVMNEFLERLASPLPDNEIAWGEETQRFEPAAIVLEKIEAAEDTAIPVVREEGSKAFHKVRFQLLTNQRFECRPCWLMACTQMDIGLPVYRPDILAPKLEHKGTLFVSHTFEDSNFLPQLQSAGRKHGVKLTGLLHAAMLNAIHNLLDPKPGPEDVFYSGSPMDLRNGHLIPEYCDRAKYVNMAIAIQPIKVPCSMFETVEANKHGLWEAAACISNQWETIKLKKEIARTAESDAKTLIEAIAGNK